MNITYEDLYIHQSLLKNMVKVIWPDAFCCMLMEKFTGGDYKVIATVILCVRLYPNINSTTMQVVDIYKDGFVHVLNTLGSSIEGVVYDWLLYKVVSEKERYSNRMDLLKRDIVSCCLTEPFDSLL